MTTNWRHWVTWLLSCILISKTLDVYFEKTIHSPKIRLDFLKPAPSFYKVITCVILSFSLESPFNFGRLPWELGGEMFINRLGVLSWKLSRFFPYVLHTVMRTRSHWHNLPLFFFRRVRWGICIPRRPKTQGKENFSNKNKSLPSLQRGFDISYPTRNSTPDQSTAVCNAWRTGEGTG